MKRTAETQLTKDGADNSDDNEEGQSGFKKADADSLATRKIKGLPKRLSGATAGGPQPTSTNNASSGSSRFAAFSGFGNVPFGKDKDNSTSAPPPSFPSFSGFGSTTTSGVSFGAKASEMPSTSSLFPASSASRSDSTSAATPPSNPTQKFFIDIRGLNNSYLKTIRESIEKDPFVDLSSTVENYRTLREGIQKDYDSNKSEQAQQAPDTNPVPTISSAASKTFSMPTPPAQFSFQLPTTAPAPQATSAPAPSGPSWPTSTEKPSTPSFSFGAPKSSSSGFFSFGSKTEGASASGMAATKSAEEKQNAEIVDKTASSPKPPPMLSFKSTSAPITPGFSSFLTSSSSNTPSSSTPSVLFGSSPTATSTANNGNIGNPLGFSFGSVPAFSSTSATTSSAPTTSDPVKPPAKEDAPETDGDEGTSESVGEGIKEDSVNPFDKESSGEEDEETLFETKSRAYVSITTEDNKKVWSPAGSGQLKLKKLKEGTRRRLLMRNSSNGKIIINTLIVPSFKLTVDGKTISFIVPSEDGSANLFKLRLSTEAEAKEWETKVSAK